MRKDDDFVRGAASAAALTSIAVGIVWMMLSPSAWPAYALASAGAAFMALLWWRG